MAGLHAGKSGKFRGRQHGIDRTSRHEIFHVGQRQFFHVIGLQRHADTAANLDRILRPFLPAALAAVAQMQNAVVIPGQAQPIRHVDRVGRRGKLVSHRRDGFVFARALNDLIDKARFVGAEDPGKSDDEILSGNCQHLAFACQL